MHTIQWKNTNKIQHKRCKHWTKYKYIVPRSNRYACNRNTESTMGEDTAFPDLWVIVWCILWCIKSVHLRDTLYAPDDAVDFIFIFIYEMQIHMSRCMQPKNSTNNPFSRTPPPMVDEHKADMPSTKALAGIYRVRGWVSLYKGGIWKHAHQSISGFEGGVTRSSWAQVYPGPFVHKIAAAVRQHCSDHGR